MKVSIITPSFNSAAFIADAIRSVQNQTLDDWEMLIVDDGSKDDTVAIVKSFVAEDSRIKLLSMGVNGGAAAARNKAIEVARGRYIAFLDSDDIWLPTKLEEQLNFIQGNGYPFVYCDYQIVSETGALISRFESPRSVNYSDLLKTCSIGCLTVIYDTNYFGKQYMPLINKRQDYALWLQLLKKIDYGYGLKKELAGYRIHENSISSNKLHAAFYQWRVYRQVERLGVFKSIYYFGWYVIFGLINQLTRHLGKRTM